MTGRLQCDDVTVTDFNQLDSLLAFPASDGQRPADINDRHTQPLIYRGYRDARWKMQCSLSVQLGSRCVEGEMLALQDFRRYAPGDQHFREQHTSSPAFDAWRWLVLGQHHGLPTRLLDWTGNPRNAMFFALDGREDDADAAITIVDVLAVHSLLPEPLAGLVADSPGSTLTFDAIAGALAKPEELTQLSDEPFMVFLEPDTFDDRILSQVGLLSVLSDPHRPAEDVLARAPGSWRRLILPPAVCEEVRDRLDQSNINEYTIYRDLDGLGRWLRRTHKARLTSGPLAPPSVDDAAPSGAPG